MNWPRALGEPAASAGLRLQPEDFQVDEILGFPADGDGEHWLLQVRKRERNTVDVAQALARWAGVPQRAVSWSGMKDRQALTTQWFSVQAPGRDIDWGDWSEPGCELLAWARHRRKLRRGSHRGNAFRLRLRAVQGDRGELAARLARVAAAGVPNYFGEQRFGRGGRNPDAARAWLSGGRTPARPLRGLLLSSARAWLFNQVLAQRVESGTWQGSLPGEILVLDGRNSLFAATGEEHAREVAGEVHPTGPLPGRPAGLAPTGAVAALEAAVLADEPVLRDGLVAQGVDAARRSLRLWPRDLEWQWQGEDLLLWFSLPGGCFATSLVRELLRPVAASTDRAGH